MDIIKGKSEGHISPIKHYISVIVSLFLLTALTVFTAKSHTIHEAMLAISEYGPIGLAMIIASAKAYLVIMYFMHVKYENETVRSYGLYFPIGLMALLIVMILLDVHYRHVGPIG